MAEPTNPPPAAPVEQRPRAPRLKVKHLDGCPARPERVEQYDAGRGNPDHTITTFTVVRCQDCGAHEARQKAG